MDFFGHQERANKQTKTLIALFLVVASVVIASLYLVYRATIPTVFPSSVASGRALFELSLMEFALFWSGAIVGFTGLSYGKLAMLRRGGGKAIAMGQNGRFIPFDTTEPGRQRLLNIVEEMSIAAGCPMPQVFEMQSSSINAFAAGWGTSDAVVGITTKAIDSLDRDELQAVVAHEFSHIVQGDMRLNMNLIAIVFSILCIYQAGRMFLGRLETGERRHSRSNGKNEVSILGIMLIVVGYLGYLGSSLIKAAISRQREFYADASAVQYTRNPEALVGAFAKIMSEGSVVNTPKAEEVAHMFFADGLRKKFSNVWSTHPELTTRVERIGSRYLKQFHNKAAKHRVASQSMRSSGVDAPSPIGSDYPADDGAEFLAHVGALPLHAQNQAKTLTLNKILPVDNLRGFYQKTWGTYEARALILGLFLHENHTSFDKQWEIATSYLSDDLQKLCRSVHKSLAGSTSRQRLALVDSALGPLKMMTHTQTRQFLMVLKSMVVEDGEIELFEYTLFTIVKKHLEKSNRMRRGSPKTGYLAAKLYVLSCLAGECVNTDKSYIEVLKALRIPLGQRKPRQAWDSKIFDEALHALNHQSFWKKKKFVSDMTSLFHMESNQKDSRLIEAMRAVCDRIGCPVALLPSN